MRILLSLLSVLLFCGSCKQEPKDSGVPRLQALDRKPVVLTTFYPTTYFAMRIAGDLADISCPLPADADPVSWKPSAEVVAAYQAADLVVTNGARLEKWIAQVSLPSSRVVKTAARFRDEWIRILLTTHSHGPGGEHSHYGTDGHTWLDPRLAIQQSRAIADALVQLRPDHKAEFEAGFDALQKDLQELHAGFEALGELAGGEFLYAAHAAYDYLARRHGWKVANLELDPATMPTDEVLADLKRQLQERPGRYLLWESDPDPAIATALQDLGLRSLVISPCERAPKAGAPDYLAQMRASIKRLAIAFE